MEPVKLYVSVVSARQWPVKFGESLVALALHLGLRHLDGRLAQVNLSITGQAHPSTTRNAHIVHALADGYTHFLSLDDDQTFPPDLVEKMLASQKPVLTGNYRKKRMDLVEHVCAGMDGKTLDSTHRTGLERCKAMGNGMALIELDAIRHIRPPYYAALWQNDRYMIEDEVFSLLLGQNGVEIWCDHDLSREIGHVGEYEYRLPPYAPVPAQEAA